MKSGRLIKRLIAGALALILIFSINGYAAIVSDNDGSAFITKAEFDSLKNSFQAQIDSYNQSIDSKIDGAIASYLAGIKVSTTTKLDSLLNKCSEYSFTNTWAFKNTLGKGDKCVGSLWMAYICEYYPDTGSTDKAEMCRATWGTTDNLMAPTTKTFGTTSDIFAVLKESTYDSSYRVIDSEVESTPTASVNLAFTSVGNYLRKPASSTFSIDPSSYTFVKKLPGTTADKTDTGSYDASLTVGFCGGTNNYQKPSMTGIISFTFSDVTKTDETALKRVAGGTVPTTVLSAYLSSESTKLGDTDTDMLISGNSGWYSVATSTTQNAGGMQAEAPNWKVSAYHHKLSTTDYKMTDIINDTISAAASTVTHYHNGLPLFKSSADGVVSFKIKCTNTNNDDTTFAIDDGQFSNAAFTKGFGGITDADATVYDVDSNAYKTDYTFTSGHTYQIKMNVTKNTSYWIKALPSTTNGTSNIITTSEIVLTEQ